MTVRSGTLPPEGVQRMFDRIAPVYDLMNRVMTVGPRPALAPARRSRRSCSPATACSTRPAEPATSRSSPRRRAATVTGLDFSERMLERARRKAPELEWVHGDLLALPFADDVASTRRPSASASGTSPTSPRAIARAAPRAATRRPARDPRDHAAARAAARSSTRCGSTASCRCSARCCPAARRTRTCRRACAASPARTTSPRR